MKGCLLCSAHSRRMSGTRMYAFQRHPLFVLHSRNRSFIQSFQRLPTDPEWDRFQRYSRKIQTFKAYRYHFTSLQVFLVLQSRAFSEPLLPNLKSLTLMSIPENLVSFITLFLSSRTTTVYLGDIGNDVSSAAIASVAKTIPILSPNLRGISLRLKQSDPMITTAVSGMLLTIKGNALQKFDVDSSLTEEAREVICGLPDLCELHTDIGGSSSLPTLVLPNLATIGLDFDRDHGWLQAYAVQSAQKMIYIARY